MLNNKEVLTYKRKRLSSQAHLAHDGKAVNSSPDAQIAESPGRLNPKVEPGSYNEKLSEDNVNFSQKKREYSTLIGRHDTEQSTQQLDRVKKRKRKNNGIEKSEIRSMELCAHKVLLSRKLSEDGSKDSNPSTAASVGRTTDSIQIDISCNTSSSACVVTSIERSSEFKMGNLEKLSRSSPVCLNSSIETKCSSECAEASISRALNPDKVLFNEEHPKENCSTPLITFCRRVKKKQIMNETSVERTIKADEDQMSSGNGSIHALESRCRAKDPSQKCSINDQSTPPAVLREQVDLSAQQVADADEDASPVGGFVETKIAGDRSEESCFHSVQGLISNHVEHVHEDPSDKCMAAPTIDLIRDSISVHETKQSNSSKIGTIDVNNTITRSDLELSIAPLSPSIFCKRAEPNNADVAFNNLAESRSSSTMVLDEEADARGKELEWLENLDKALQEKKKNRSKCSFRGSSNGRASSPRIPISTCMQSSYNQGETRGCSNQITPLSERIFLTRLGEPACSGAQQLEKLSIRSSLCLPLSLNSERPIGSVAKDFRNFPSQSSLGMKETDFLFNGLLPWHAYNEASRQKQILEDSMIGRRISKGLPYRRYSNEWSEEELDYLWIGVRRHGMYNWNAMLRDPKLRFLESRVPEDLAKRWDLEQRKLLNGTLIQPANHSRPVLDGSWSRSFPEHPITAAETRLSLGDIYVQKENIRRRNTFQSPSSGDRFPNPSPFLANTMAGARLGRAQSTWLEGESSSHERQQQPVDRTAVDSNLPHWLKEVIGTPPGSISAPISSVPFLNLGEAGRGILKRKSLGFRISEPSSIIETRLGPLPSSGVTGPDQNTVSDLNKRSSGPLGDLVVIESDASSEETISDDQGSRL